MSAISINPVTHKASIDPDECSECYNCSRARICPTDAIVSAEELLWPRNYRHFFSDVLEKHPLTGISGRGTAESKSNDREHRYQRGSIGIAIEPGRPCLGVRLRDVEKIVMEFTSRGFAIERANPVCDFIENFETGAFFPETLNEKLVSCVVELVIPDTAAAELMEILHKLEKKVESGFDCCVILRADEDGSSPFWRLFGKDAWCLPDVKHNLGFAEGIVPPGGTEYPESL